MLPHERFSLNELLTIGRRLGARPGDFDLCLQAQLGLFGRVGDELLGELEVLPARLGLIAQGDEVPVELLHPADRRNHLIFEVQVFDLLVVAGNANVAGVDRAAEALRQPLADAQAQVGGLRGIEVVADVVVRLPERGQAEVDCRAGYEALLIADVGESEVAGERILAGDQGGNLWVAGPVQPDRARQHGVEIGDLRTEERSRVARAAAGGLCGLAGALSDAGGLPRRSLTAPSAPASAPHALAGGKRRDLRLYAAQVGAGLGAQQVSLRLERRVTGDLDVEIVLERERQCIGQRKVQLSVADQVAQPRGVAQIGFRHLPHAVDPEVPKTAVGQRIVEVSNVAARAADRRRETAQGLRREILRACGTSWAKSAILSKDANSAQKVLPIFRNSCERT